MFSFTNLNLKNKIILGFIPLLLCMVIITGFSFFSLKEADRINRNFIDQDLVLLETADKLIDKVLAQELYGRRYTILKDHEMKTMFWNQSKAFEKLVTVIKKMPEPHNNPAEQITALHAKFNSDYETWFRKIEGLQVETGSGNDIVVQKKLDELIDYIRNVAKKTKECQRLAVIKTREMALKTINRIVILSCAGILIGGLIASLITGHISRSVTQLKLATRKIAVGEFDYPLKINDSGEFGELARAFKEMAKRLAQLEEMYLDASPLTRLPGGIAIENVLKRRLKTNHPLAFALIDLDNFKSYNDKYGYAQGNEIIRSSAEIIRRAVTDHGTENDFVGHIGGDDFSVITTPEKYTAICQAITDNFDNDIHRFYDDEDKEKGFITSVNRQGEKMTFPIMTISIAVVVTTRNEKVTGVEIGEIAAELKKYAKSFPKSIFVVNRRERVSPGRE